MLTIKKLRERAGLTQGELASILSIERSTVGKWETNESNPRVDKIPEIAKILNCSIGELFESINFERNV